MYIRYRNVGSTITIISILGKKNTGKKTLKEDHGLGYSELRLALTLHPNTHFKLSPPPQKELQLSPMHYKNLNMRVVGKANLRRKVPDGHQVGGSGSQNLLPL